MERNMSWASKKCNQKRHQNNPMVRNKDVEVGNRIDDSSCRWSITGDEDYIVLCFEEEEPIDVLKDNKDVNSGFLIKGADGKHKNSRHVNRKLKYDDDEEQFRDLNIQEKRSNAIQKDTNQHDKDFIIPYNEDKEKETVYSGRRQFKDTMVSVCQTEEIEDLEMVSAKSRDSDESESSARSSFAFPMLSWEWMESPVQMPKPEGKQKKKQKTRIVPFQCCRF